MSRNGSDGVHNAMTEDPVYDLVGVGFGPSNLALAVAIAEQYESHQDLGADIGVVATFLEQKERFEWHGGMLIDDSTMQISFLKDLATIRNPTSQYSFVAYLAAKGRLVDFINQKTFFPTRLEFQDYLGWAAGHFAGMTEYSARVVNMRPVRRDENIACIEVAAVNAANGRPTPHVRFARNVVVATGLRPALPAGVKPTERSWHSAELLPRTTGLPPDQPYRFVVVGAGQSAAEVVRYLHRSFGNADVHAVFARYGYSIADDTAFANRIFDPTAVDDYYSASAEFKQRLLNYHRNTNYSVVDSDLIDDLYGRVYRERVAGRQRLHVHNMSSVAQQAHAGDKVRLTLCNLASGEPSSLLADYVVYATGYTPADPAEMIGDLADLCERDSAGHLLVQRDYRVAMVPGVTCGVYLQGSTEHSHGISSSLLSNAAVRAGEILTSIRGHLATGARPAGPRADALNARAR